MWLCSMSIEFSVGLSGRFTQSLDQDVIIAFPPINTNMSSESCVELQWSVKSGEDMRITVQLLSPSLNGTLSSVVFLHELCALSSYPGQIGQQIYTKVATRFNIFLDIPIGLQQASVHVRVQGHLIEELTLHRVITHSAHYCERPMSGMLI